jgi:hypothetical protein
MLPPGRRIKKPSYLSPGSPALRVNPESWLPLLAIGVAFFRYFDYFANEKGMSDLLPVIIPSFKLGWGSSQAREPGAAWAKI